MSDQIDVTLTVSPLSEPISDAQRFNEFVIKVTELAHEHGFDGFLLTVINEQKREVSGMLGTDDPVLAHLLLERAYTIVSEYMRFIQPTGPAGIA